MTASTTSRTPGAEGPGESGAEGVVRLAGRDLSIGYGEKTIITGLDIQIPTGELTVIVGPNACGKSTLLRALARVLPARSGQVVLDGRPIGDYRPQQPPDRLTVPAADPGQ